MVETLRIEKAATDQALLMPSRPTATLTVPAPAPRVTAVPVAQPWVLTLDGEEHGLADVCAHTIAGLAEVVANVLLQHMADEQGAVGQDLDAARQGDGVVLLGVATS